MLQRLIFSTNTRLSIIILLIQSQSWLREGGKKTWPLSLPIYFYQDAYACRAHMAAAAAAPARSSHYIISRYINSPLFIKTPQQEPHAPLTVEGISCDLTSHGWMQGAFTLLSDDRETFTFGTARVRGRLHSPGGTRWTRNACQRRLTSAPRSPHQCAAASASDSTLRLAPASRTDHAQIIIKGGVGGGASGP